MCKEKELGFERGYDIKCPRCCTRIHLSFTDSGELLEVVDRLPEKKPSEPANAKDDENGAK